MNATRPETRLRGNGVSPGIAVGHALKLDSHYRFILKLPVAGGDLDAEVRRFRQAVEQARAQLENLRRHLEEKVGKEHSIILDAHLLMLEDPSLMEAIEGIIRRNQANAEWAVREAADRVRLVYDALEDEYFRERGSDIEHVVERLLSSLMGDKPFHWDAIPDDVILVAHDLSPAAFAAMDLQKVRGIALEAGGRTSHTAILARSLRLPAVMEIRDLMPSIRTGDPAILNADEGELTVWPSSAQRDAVQSIMATKARPEPPEVSVASCAVTLDGVRISLRANTELPHEAAVARKCGAHGIGLFRSEFIFFAHPQGPPTMQEQLEIYGLLAREMNPHSVAVRTLDTGVARIGSPKDAPAEANPSMGLRGIRLGLARRRLFTAQVEAILRASYSGSIEIVIPMISTVEEVREARRVIDQVRLKIQQSAGAPVPGVPLGVMIEIPAAVLTLESIAAEVDFMCVGTNDLVQYLLAVDRNNPQVAHLFQPLHPSVLHCMSRIATVSSQTGKPARICGEISSNPFFAVLLLGMGYRQLSMNPLSIPPIRAVIGRLRLHEAEAIARRTLEMPTAREISEYLIDAVPRLLGMDLQPYIAELRKPAFADEPPPGT